MGNVAVKHRYFHIRYEASTPNNSATIALSDYSRPTIQNYAVSMNGTYLVPVRKPLFFEKVIDLNFNCSA